MKFLIFNAIVFCSLGYLLTSTPNENFNQWFSDKKSKITNFTKEDYLNKMKNAVSEKNHNIDKNNFNSISRDQLKKEHAEKMKNAIKIAKNKNELKIKNKKLQNELETIKEELAEIKKQKIKNNSTNLHYNHDHKNIKTFPKKSLPNNETISDEIQQLANKYKKDEISKNKKSKNLDEKNFLSPEERGQALAELITDLEIYSIKGIIN